MLNDYNGLDKLALYHDGGNGACDIAAALTDDPLRRRTIAVRRRAAMPVLAKVSWNMQPSHSNETI